MKMLFVLIGALNLYGCRPDANNRQLNEKESAIQVIVDVTDPQKLQIWPRPVPILRLYHCDLVPEQACSFKLRTISDISINREYQVYLPTKAVTEKLNLTDDILHRKNNILRFYDSVKTLFNRFYIEKDTTNEKEFSECWTVIVKSLAELSLSGATTKAIIVFSDLAEKSALGNAYTSKMSTDTIAMKGVLEKAISQPQNMKGSEMYIVYQPNNREDEARFNKMLQAYKQMLEPYGMIVHHQSNADTFE